MICIGILNFEKFKSFCDLPILDLIMFVRFAVSQARYTQNRLVISYWAGRNDGRLLLFPFVNKHSRFQESLVTCPGGDFVDPSFTFPRCLLKWKCTVSEKTALWIPLPRWFSSWACQRQHRPTFTWFPFRPGSVTWTEDGWFKADIPNMCEAMQQVTAA